MTDDQVALRLLTILQEFAGRIRARLPESHLLRAEHTGPNRHGIHGLYAEFYLPRAQEALCLSFTLRRTEGGLECEPCLYGPDLHVDAGPWTIQDTNDPRGVATLIDKARDFAHAQEARAVSEIQRDASRAQDLPAQLERDGRRTQVMPEVADAGHRSRRASP